MTDGELFREIDRRLRLAVIHHNGPVGHGFTTPSPDNCGYCWIVLAIRDRELEEAIGPLPL